MKQVILMRHGRSLLNDDHHAHERDNVLAWRGVLATLAEAEPLKNAGIARVISSPIPRAYQTAMLAVGAIGRGVPISLHPEIAELRGKQDEPFALTVYEDDAPPRPGRARSTSCRAGASKASRWSMPAPRRSSKPPCLKP